MVRMNPRLVLLLVSGLCVAVPAMAAAQGRPPRPRVVDIASSGIDLVPGRTAQAVVTVVVKTGFKVQANPPSEGLIATTLTLEPSEGLFYGPPVYPKSKTFTLEGIGELLVYDGTFTITLPVSAARNVVAGPRTLTGTLRYQACDETTCLLPINAPVTIDARIAAISQKRRP